MQIIKSTLDYENLYKNKLKDKTIGFVPTMGYLHDGHLSLIKECIKNNDKTIVTIFVNPTQFGKGEDFSSYPRNTEQDILLLEQAGVDFLFMPEVEDMYPKGHSPIIQLEINSDFNNKLCGKYRPGHFKGVAMIVMKLFSIIKADNTYFGLKDYQQYILIKNLALTFYPGTKVSGLPTIREDSGLAMSSRNSYLTPEDKKIASSIYDNLTKLSEIIKNTKKINLEELTKSFELSLAKTSNKLKLQYLEIYDKELNTINSYQPQSTFIGVAVYLNKVRLIDNIIF